MRPRPDIEKHTGNWLSSEAERLQLEVLLDIRELLEELVRSQSLRE